MADEDGSPPRSTGSADDGEPAAGGAAGWVVAALVLAAGVGLALLGGQDVAAPLGRGAAAPDFTVPTLESRPLSLAEHRGRVVLLNFWATWCKPCEEEMPAMERLYQQLRPQGFELLAISVDDEAAPVREFRERLAISFPIGLDPDEDVARRLYQVMGYPETLLIDARGRVVERYVGPRAWDDPLYVERVRTLIAEGG